MPGQPLEHFCRRVGQCFDQRSVGAPVRLREYRPRALRRIGDARAFCSAVPAAGTIPDEHAVAPLGAASRSNTRTSFPGHAQARPRTRRRRRRSQPPASSKRSAEIDDDTISTRSPASTVARPSERPTTCQRHLRDGRSSARPMAASIDLDAEHSAPALICGAPNRCHARLNCGSPVLCKPRGASPGALGASTISAAPNNSSTDPAHSRPVRRAVRYVSVPIDCPSSISATSGGDS